MIFGERLCSSELGSKIAEMFAMNKVLSSLNHYKIILYHPDQHAIQAKLIYRHQGCQARLPK